MGLGEEQLPYEVGNDGKTLGLTPKKQQNLNRKSTVCSRRHSLNWGMFSHCGVSAQPSPGAFAGNKEGISKKIHSVVSARDIQTERRGEERKEERESEEVAAAGRGGIRDGQS